MIYELSQKFYFEAAHTLHRAIDAKGSRRIHGHTYNAEVTIAGDIDSHTGMITDLEHFRRMIDQVRRKLDHQFLDEVQGLGPATLENLCRFIYDELSEEFAHLNAISIERIASGDKCTLRRS
jgi:6-pyruvoyltetrahydropterin/6-carboxytetrahydropterin synthase